MSERIPILRIGDILVVSVQFDLEDQTVLNLREDPADQIVAKSAQGVIIDISALEALDALEIVDSFVGHMLATVAAISRGLDAVAEGTDDLEELCDLLLARFGHDKDDDIALIAALFS